MKGTAHAAILSCRNTSGVPLALDTSGRKLDMLNCRALAVQVDESMRKAILIDVLTVHGATGKSIIFTKTKRAADEIAAGVALTIPCEVSLQVYSIGLAEP